ncbi:uncharacterized protein HGUI_02236 [Hanseniaspora guilliermondii]|uniref:Uncharacterized protein n=1 Tax=Hanseniaspora guilliermondii TaxID=56406 RepID=A0A1L0B2J0_9ASCO|nr:uncharacterized protein HGUI_02236 [Hanseniaspora guilliermondii]
MYLHIKDIYSLDAMFLDIPELKLITETILVHKSYFLKQISWGFSNHGKIHMVPKRNVSDSSTPTNDSFENIEIHKTKSNSIADDYLKHTLHQQDLPKKNNKSDTLLVMKNQNGAVKRDISTRSISDKIKFFEQQIKLHGQ